MESNQNQLRGIINKSKVVMSFYRTPKPASSTTNQLQPNPPPAVVEQPELAAALLPPLPNQQKVKSSSADNNNNNNNIVGGGAATTLEETVDTRAASYISHVRERFRLERVHSDGPNYQDIHY